MSDADTSASPLSLHVHLPAEANPDPENKEMGNAQPVLDTPQMFPWVRPQAANTGMLPAGCWKQVMDSVSGCGVGVEAIG